jgi:tetratricopeptide (TPR) repeat protein
MHKQLAYLYNVSKLDGDAARFDRAIDHAQNAHKVYSRASDPENWASTHYALALAYAGTKQGDPIANARRALQHVDQTLQVFRRTTYPDQWEVAHAFKAQVQEYLTIHSARSSARSSARPSSRPVPGHPNLRFVTRPSRGSGQRERPSRSSSRLTYPQAYQAESRRKAGEPRTLNLIQSGIPDFPHVTHLILVYQWEEGLSDEEAERLCKRAVVYVACGIYDAATAAGLYCRASAIMNGRRPTWQIKGEAVLVSLILSDVDLETRTCQMTIGAMVTQMGKAPSSWTHWEQLHAGFRARFSSITV